MQPHLCVPCGPPHAPPTHLCSPLLHSSDLCASSLHLPGVGRGKMKLPVGAWAVLGGWSRPENPTPIVEPILYPLPHPLCTSGCVWQTPLECLELCPRDLEWLTYTPHWPPTTTPSTSQTAGKTGRWGCRHQPHSRATRKTNRALGSSVSSTGWG